jgi:hypothetical protein
VARTILDQTADGPVNWSERDVVLGALATVAQAKQSWTRSELQRAVSDALPGNLGLAPEQIRPLLERVTDKAEALARHLNPRTGQGWTPEGDTTHNTVSNANQLATQTSGRRLRSRHPMVSRANLSNLVGPRWACADLSKVDLSEPGNPNRIRPGVPG